MQTVTAAATMTIRNRRVGVLLAGATITLTAASYSMHLVTRSIGAETIAALDVGDEVSLSTWFQTLLFVAAALVLMVGRQRAAALQERTWGWGFLAAVMVALSIDEAVSLHERAGSALRDLLDTGGVLYYIWVLPALVFVAVVAAIQFRWWAAFPQRPRILLAASAIIFVGGAAGLELLASAGDEAHGTATMLSISLAAAEEFMEMVGLSLFVWTLLGTLSDHTTLVRFAHR